MIGEWIEQLVSRGKAGYRRPVQLNLIAHPSTPPSGLPFKVWANVDYAGAFGATATLNIWYGVDAPLGRFALEEPGPESLRRHGLWQSTCFEAFLRAEGETVYQEWNFAPSGDWAAYDFPRYREDMANAEVGSPPYIRTEDNFTWWTLGATIAVASGPRWSLGLSAVLEEGDGTKSYWALAHPPGDKPDFHHADCFVAKLP